MHIYYVASKVLCACFVTNRGNKLQQQKVVFCAKMTPVGIEPTIFSV